MLQNSHIHLYSRIYISAITLWLPHFFSENHLPSTHARLIVFTHLYFTPRRTGHSTAIAKSWFNQAAEYLKQTIALTPDLTHISTQPTQAWLHIHHLLQARFSLSTQPSFQIYFLKFKNLDLFWSCIARFSLSSAILYTD